MAANSTLLALPCGAGVPVPRSHLRRNLVSKAHKTAIMMAVKPAMPYEGSVLFSIPHQLHRTSVIPKRNKTVVAAYPDIKFAGLETIPGVPEYTQGELENDSGEELKLDDMIIWAGSQSEIFPPAIENSQTGEFTHRADSKGSIGGLEYVFLGGEYKWIIAWSNAKDDVNKVYSEILKGVANWERIRESLDTSGDTSIFPSTDDIPFSSKVVIDKTCPTPTMQALIKQGPIEDAESQKADENAKP